MIQMRLPPFLIDAIVAGVTPVMDTPPAQELGVPGSVYLRRWYLQRAATEHEGNAYLHETLRSDADDEAHDHPWDNMSIVLRGVLGEEVEDHEGVRTVHMRHPGDVVVRRAEDRDRHRLIVDGPVLTLFVTGPKVQEWGFWCDDGWMHNRDFFKRAERMTA